jgi:DNA modification methylase
VFGLEPTPELYLEHTLIIFREVWRVLRKDGTLWINLGDSYATGAGSARSPGGNCFGKQNAVVDSGNFPRSQANRMPIVGLKPGDLVVIPWRVALALQSDGWYLRRDNIWFKPNPMPESVNGWRWEKHRIKVGRSDRVPSHQKSSVTSSVPQSVGLTRAGREGRANIEAPTIECPGCAKCEPNGGLILRKGNWRCTTSHEYVFQFSKSDSYFCDAEAARERSTGRPSGNKKRFIAKKDGERGRINNHLASCVPWAGATNRNRRSVWPIATAPFKDAHFATFPPALVRPIIQAASPVKCCSECGAAWAPIVERGQPNRAQQRACGGDQNGEYRGTATKDFIDAGAEDASAVKARILAGMVTKTVIGYRPTCDHAATGIPAMVLDPFGGSGTVAQVSLEEGRAAVVIELSREYLPMIHKRCAVTHGLAL